MRGKQADKAVPTVPTIMGKLGNSGFKTNDIFTHTCPSHSRFQLEANGKFVSETKLSALLGSQRAAKSLTIPEHSGFWEIFFSVLPAFFT